MNIIQAIEKLKDYLLDKFRLEIESKKEVDYHALEMAIRNQQNCGFNEAKTLMNLLWYPHSDELHPLYRLVNHGKVPLEVKRTFGKAEKIE